MSGVSTPEQLAAECKRLAEDMADAACACEAGEFVERQRKPLHAAIDRLAALSHPAVPLRLEACDAAVSEWRCFHCDEVFTDLAAAKEHFGSSEHQQPACQIDIKHVRWLEEQHRRGVEDDTEALRTIRAIVGEHEELRRRAEEQGYARGLEDARKHPEELGLTAAPSPAPAPHAAQPNQRAINDSMLDRTSPRYSEYDLRRMLDGIEASAKEFGLVMMAGALGGFSFRKHATQAQAGPQYSDKAYIGDLEYELNRRDDLAKCASQEATRQDERDRRDAERYRFLCEVHGPRTELGFAGELYRGKAEFDAAIDAAMSSTPGAQS